MSNRSANIDSVFEQKIVDCIKTIKYKITWAKVIDLVESISGERYTEQGLRKREKIANAYSLQKNIILKEKGVKKEGADQEVMRRKIVQLEEEKKASDKIINQLYDKFRIWAYNAKEKGLTEDQLSRPLEFDDDR